MTTNPTTAEDRLATRGLHLPEAPTPCGASVPAVPTGQPPGPERDACHLGPHGNGGWHRRPRP
jgi:hypothetical protein